MKQKKQMKIILSLVTLISIALAGCIITQSDKLKAANNKQVTSEVTTNQIVGNSDGLNRDGGFGTDFPLLPTINYEVPGLWINSFTGSIPSTSTFSLYYRYDPTGHFNVIDHSDNLYKTTQKLENGQEVTVYRFGKEDETVESYSAGTQFWLVLDNAGYYNGDKIFMKITVSSDFELMTTSDVNRLGIVVSEEQFLRIDYVSKASSEDIGKEKNRLRVKYEFFQSYDKENPNNSKNKNVKGYLNFSNLNDKNISFPRRTLENIYSMPEIFHDTKLGEDAEIELGYRLSSDDTQLDIIGLGTSWASFARVQHQFTSVFKESSEWIWTYPVVLTPMDDMVLRTQAFIPSGETIVKILIPNPQVDGDLKNQQINEITATNSANLPYSFVQQIPYEMKRDAETPAVGVPNGFGDYSPAINHRNQAMEWRVSPVLGEEKATVVPIATEDNASWLVENENGNDAKDYFIRTVDEEKNYAKYLPIGDAAEPETIDGVDNAPQADGFYNHYYTFKDYMKIDYQNPINRDQLKVLPGSNSSIMNYLDLTSTVDFEVKGPKDQKYGNTGNAAEDKEFHTWINFEADVDYQIYLLEEDNDPEKVTTPFETIKGNDKVPPTTPENEDESADDKYVLWGDSYIPKLVTHSLNLTKYETDKITAYAKSNGYVFSPEYTKYVVGGNFDQNLNTAVTNQIGYTNGNVVKLYFKRAPFLEVNELNFEQTKLPISKDPGTYIKRDDSFNLSVSDPNGTNLEWSVAVRLKTPFYKAEDNEAKTPVDALQNSLRVVSNNVVYQEIPTNNSITLATDLTENIGPYNFTEKWKPNTGILLYLTKENSQKLAAEIKADEKTEESYKAELEFTVTIAEPEGGD